MNVVSSNSRALILLAHGSNDPDWAAPLTRIKKLVGDKTGRSVYMAFLTLMKPSLPELLLELSQEAISSVTVVPVFLGPGNHVRQDIHALQQKIAQTYPQISIHFTQPVSESDLVLNAIADYCISAI